jgi:hypothetical protein
MRDTVPIAFVSTRRDSAHHIIVKMRPGQSGSDRRTELGRFELRWLERIGDNTYRCHFPSGDLISLRKEESVEFADAPNPRSKIERSLIDLQDEKVKVYIVPQFGEITEKMAEQLFSAEVLEREKTSVHKPWIIATIDKKNIDVISEIESVRKIEPHYDAVLM